MTTHHPSADLRTLTLAGHSGSGKTTLAERLLAACGAVGEAGSVERGTTVSDHDPLEKKHQHSLNSAVLHAAFDGIGLTLIDTPGLMDFRAAALAAMAATETVAIVVNAQAGIELATRRLMRRAKARRLCRMIIVNKIDTDDLNLEALVEDLRAEFGAECLPVNLPANNRTTVKDCFFHDDGQTDILSLAEAHTRIVEQTVEVDEDLMAAYLEQGEVGPEALHDAFEKALREGHVVPICFVSARTGAGIPELLQFFKRLLPSPLEGNPPPYLKGESGDTERVTAQPDPDGHVLTHVFKIINDPYVGKLAVFRIHQGTVKPETQLYIGHARKPFKINHLFALQGGKYTETASGIPGEIRAVAKIDEIHYDDVLHDSHDEDLYHLAPIDYPQPMYALAIEAKTRGQEQKVAAALGRLAEEDPCIQIDHNQELNETVVRGLGDYHLRLLVERLNERYGVEVVTRPPRIAYRETVSRPAEGHHRHKKQTGGAGQFGEVYLRIRPLARGEGFRFVNEVVGGAIPYNFIPAVEKGVLQVLQQGAIAGYTMQDVEVTVYDGKHHSVDSKEIAFVTAGRKAFLDAIAKAGPQILEPIVHIEVVAPEAMMGDITGSLAAHRARINGTDSLRGGQIAITADAPLSEMMDYHIELKSLTGGQASYSLDFSHYDPVPADVQARLTADYQPGAEHE